MRGYRCQMVNMIPVSLSVAQRESSVSDMFVGLLRAAWEAAKISEPRTLEELLFKLDSRFNPGIPERKFYTLWVICDLCNAILVVLGCAGHHCIFGQGTFLEPGEPPTPVSRWNHCADLLLIVDTKLPLHSPTRTSLARHVGYTETLRSLATNVYCQTGIPQNKFARLWTKCRTCGLVTTRRAFSDHICTEEQ